MTKLIVVTFVAVLFFFAGLFAGHRVPRANALDTGRDIMTIRSSAVDSLPAADLPIDPTGAAGSSPHSFVSSTAPLMVEKVRSVELTGSKSDEQTNEDPNKEQRAAILKLIQRQFPDTDAEVADIWADTYVEMDLDEIRFILEQKRRISTSLGASVTPPHLNSTIPTFEPLNCTPAPSTNIAVRTVQLNLQSVYSLGFCRMAVFPEVASDPDSLSTDKKHSLHTTSFRCFESGPQIQSPIHTHVALAESSSTMFRLDANRLTRRGDFQLLNNRRLGIVTRSGEMASAESTPIPEDAANIRITANGVIQYRNAAGETGEAGRVSVCRVANPAELHTADGVIFESSNADNLELHGDAAGLLLTNTLEQSNVDRTYENSLLTYLKSLSETSF